MGQSTKSPQFQELATRHILEPIAFSSEISWLTNAYGNEKAIEIIKRFAPAGDEYELIQKLETAHGINHPTRLALHDIALIIPFVKRTESSGYSFETSSPPNRILAAISAIGSGKVRQIDDTESASYRALAGDLSVELGWPEMEASIKVAIKYAESLRELFSQCRWHFADDFLIAFNTRLKEPDAFICPTSTSINLLNNGWQPLWNHPEGLGRMDSISESIYHDKVRSFLRNKLTDDIVINGSPSCPLPGKNCRIECKGTLAESENHACIFWSCFQEMTGGLFSGETIDILR